MEETIRLSKGTVLKARYTIKEIIGEGGFGVTYLAWDITFDRKVAIKEYYPIGIANRAANENVVNVYTETNRNEYRRGLERFLEEARELLKFNSRDNIVSVYDFFEENNTAYMVMEYLEGCTIKEYVEKNREQVDEAFIVQIFFSVLEAMETIHKEGVIHRDITPDNLFICNDLSIKLLDFGAAKQSIAENQKTVSVILKEGYAPPEQYSKRGNVGPWTDIYSFGATLYYLVTGVIPEDSISRMSGDELAPIDSYNPQIPDYINTVIMKSMELKIEDRYNSVEEIKKDLNKEDKLTEESSSALEEQQKIQPKTEKVVCKEETPIKKDKKIKTKKHVNKIVMALVIAVIAISGIIAAVVIMHDRNKKVEVLEDIEHHLVISNACFLGEQGELWFRLEGGYVGGFVNKDYGVEWNSSDESVLKIDSGYSYSCLKPGTSMLTATYEGKTYGKIVTVIDPPVDCEYKLLPEDDEISITLDGEYSSDNLLWIDFKVIGAVPKNAKIVFGTNYEVTFAISSYKSGELGEYTSIGGYPVAHGDTYIYAYLINSETYEVYAQKDITIHVKISREDKFCADNDIVSDDTANTTEDNINNNISNNNFSEDYYSLYENVHFEIEYGGTYASMWNVVPVGKSDYVSLWSGDEIVQGSAWESSNPSVISVSADGCVECLDIGSAVISTEYEGEIYGIVVSSADFDAVYPDIIRIEPDECIVPNDGTYTYDNQYYVDLFVDGELPPNAKLGFWYDWEASNSDVFCLNSTGYSEDLGITSLGGYPNSGGSGSNNYYVYLWNERTGEVYAVKEVPITVQ